MSVILALVLFDAVPAAAHSPHDDVTRLVLGSGGSAGLPVMWALVRHILLESLDGGISWRRVSAGLWRARPSDLASGPTGIAVLEERCLHLSTGGEGWARAELPEGVSGRCLGSGPAGFVVLDRDSRLWQLSAGSTWRVVGEGITSVDPGGSGLVGTADGVVRRHGQDGEPSEVAQLGTSVDVVREGPEGPLFASGATVHLPDGREVELPDRVVSLCDDGDRVVAVVGALGVWVSDDRATFRQACDGLTTDRQADEPGFETDQFHDVVTWGSTGRLLVAGFDGLFLGDGTGRWIENTDILPRSLVAHVAASGSDIVISTYGAGVGRRRADGTEALDSLGLRAKRTFAAQPIGDGRTVVGTQAQGALLSTDGGRNWSDSPLLFQDGGAAKVSARARAEARRLAYRVADRLGPASLEAMRSLYKSGRSRMDGPAKLPAFGSCVAEAQIDGQMTIFVATAPAGVFASSDGGRSFVLQHATEPGRLRGIVVVGEVPIALLADGVLVREDGAWVERSRPAPGADDRCAAWGARLVVAGEHGLWATADTGRTWEPLLDDREGFAVVAPGARGTLLAQRDDGTLLRLSSGSDEPEVLAPAGSPVFRHATSFPDLTPLLVETDDGTIWGSDQFSLGVVEAGRFVPQQRTVRYQIDRPEVRLSGRWQLESSDAASGGVVGRTRSGELDLDFRGTACTVVTSEATGAGWGTVELDGQVVPHSSLPEPPSASGSSIRVEGLDPDRLHHLKVTAGATAVVDAIDIERPPQ